MYGTNSGRQMGCELASAVEMGLEGPGIQLDRPAGAGEFPVQGDWFVLHVRNRQEKALARDMGRAQVNCYVPLLRETHYYGAVARRKANVDLPLFPGYVFLRGTVEQAYAADRTGRVARIIPVVAQDRLDWELRNLHHALRHGGTRFHPHPCLQRGTRVEVRSGPFRGLQGVIEGLGRGTRLILQVQMLGRAVSLELEGALLSPLN